MSNNVRASVLVMALLATTTTGAFAASAYSGVVTGAWSQAVLTGNSIDAATGAAVANDTTTTARCNVSPCPGMPSTGSDWGSSTLIWGDGDSGLTGTDIYSSTVTFQGVTFEGVAPWLDNLPGDTFELGTLTYTNGTSYNWSMIYGATLTLGATLNGSNEVVTPFVVQLDIVPTTNTGTAAQNADFLSFGNSLGTTAPVTFNVLEGATATAILRGRLVGDPVLYATGITLAPGSESAGFIGNGVPAVPEPSAWAMFAAGLAVISRVARRKV